MFLVSGPQLVIASCNAGMIGTFPALNPRSEGQLDEWITEIKTSIPVGAVYGVNLIVHKSNPRLAGNLEEIVKHKVPLIITSLGAAKEVVDAVHSYGGVIFHDVTNITHATKAVKAGVDGLIAVSAGAGGHAGLASPFALIPQLRSAFPEIIIACSGAVSTGGGVKAALALGADAAYMGTRFIATTESLATDDYKQMLVTEKTGPAPTFLPIEYSNKVSGVHANFLRASLIKNNLDLATMVTGKEDFSKLHADGKTSAGKAWKDVWSAGHGVLTITDIPTVAELTQRLEDEYSKA